MCDCHEKKPRERKIDDQVIQSAPRQGFWSYVVDDDAADQGRIKQLAEDVRAEYEAATGEPVSLFLDATNLEWGDDWRQRIDEALESAAFFIPVITPRFFQSKECRRELRRFLERAELLGVKELLLPIYYRTVKALEGEFPESHPDPELLRAIRDTQRIDWRELRFKDRASEDYRRAVADVVARLVAAWERIESASVDVPEPTLPPIAPENRTAEDDEPGDLDLLADLEQSMEGWNESLTLLNRGQEESTAAMGAATNRINESSSSRDRQHIIRQLASELEAPTQQLIDASQQMAVHVRTADPGAQFLFAKAAELIETGSPEQQEMAKTLFATTRKMGAASAKMNASVSELLGVMRTTSKLSRHLRPVLRRQEQAYTVAIEAGEVIQGWVALIDRLEAGSEDN